MANETLHQTYYKKITLGSEEANRSTKIISVSADTEKSDALLTLSIENVGTPSSTTILLSLDVLRILAYSLMDAVDILEEGIHNA